MSASHRNAAAQGAFPASSTVAQAFEAFIAEQAFPCLGAKAASARDSMPAEHGKAPEAHQYRGRAVDAHGVRPFHAQGDRQ